MKKKQIHQNWFMEAGDGGALSALLGGKNTAVPVVLPHDHLVEIPRRADEPNGPGNGYFHEENMVYHTKIQLGAEADGKRIWLEFEGVYQNAFVYINGSFAGKCAYGYSNFYLDITRFVCPGRQNEIRVIVKNGVPSGRWYTGGGIYRNVNLMIADPVHFMPDGVFVKTTHTEDELAAVHVQMGVANDTCRYQKVILKASILDQNGEEAACGQMPVSLSEAASDTFQIPLYVKNPELWDVDHPYLYRYITRIVKDGAVLDEESGTFGIRSLSLDPVHGLRVNGKTVKLRGGCIHHDNGVIGAREFPLAAMERIRILKEAGFNAVRSSHYPISRQLLDACDRLGMFVMDEYSDVWTTSKVAFDYSMHMTEWWEHDIANMIRKDRNHPCVIMYSIGNEIPETGDAADAAWGKKFADKIRTLDPTRYTTNAMNLLLTGMDMIQKMAAESGQGDAAQTGEINTMMNSMGELMAQLIQSHALAEATEEAASQVDIVGYNYTLARYEPEGKEYPGRIIVGTETNPADLDRNWEAVLRLPYVIGDFDWTAWDYLGEAGIGEIGYGENAGPMGMMYAPYPHKAAYCGDVNLIGDRRPVSYWREIIWGLRTKPYIAVQPPAHYGENKIMSQWTFSDAVRSWNFRDYAGKGIVVEVYAEADEIELVINGTPAGRKKTGGKKRALTVFDTVYEPGKIEAIAYRDGKEVGRDMLETASDDVRLAASVIAPQQGLPADGSDIAYVDVVVVDQEGRINMEAEREVCVFVEGPAAVIGFGSASPCNEENYYDTSAMTYEGRLRAAIRANAEGTVCVTFWSGELETMVRIPAVYPPEAGQKDHELL